MYLNAQIQFYPRRIKQQIFYSIVLLLFIPTFLPRIVEIPNWYALSNLMILIVVFCFLLVSILIKKLGQCTIYCSIFFLYLLFVTAIKNPDELYACATRSFSCISFVFIAEYMLYRIGTKRTIEIWYHFLAFISWVNTACMILFPNGLYHTVNYGTGEQTVKNTASFVRLASSRVHWLLGHQTGIMKYLLPILCVSLLYYYIEGGKKQVRLSVVLVWISCIIQMVIANSATNYIVFLCFISLLILLKISGKWMALKPIYFIPLAVIIYGILLNMSGELGILTVLSEQMGRTVEIGSRILIWWNTIQAWLTSPILGCGFLNESSANIWNLLGVANTHSGYLWILYEGGIIATLMFIYFCTRLYRGKRIYQKGNLELTLVAAVYSVLIAMIADDYFLRTPFTFIIFIFAYHADTIWLENQGEGYK